MKAMEFKYRKRNRKIGFDYSSENIYFLTICIQSQKHDFGYVHENKMILSKDGDIAEEKLKWLEKQYSYVIIHNAVVMPNHVHILLEIDRQLNPSNIKIKSVSELMGAFKTTTSKQIHLNGNNDFQWQRSFHDHIVRDTKAYENIFNYISENPARWHKDIHNNAVRKIINQNP